MLGKIEGRRRRGQQRIKWLEGITNSMDMSPSKLQQILNGHESEQTPGDSEGQGSLVCCSPQHRKE